jgi:DNA (cytosine-5)-methyltransferase 1
MLDMRRQYTSIELCAGAGGQALGLEAAGFRHEALVEIDPHACQTLRRNRPYWNVIGPPTPEDPYCGDIRYFDATPYENKVDLLAGGVPCPPFSVAGKQLGHLDERDLFPHALRIAKECKPSALLLENVRGLMDPRFNEYRERIEELVEDCGLKPRWRLLNASMFGVPQLRPRTILIGLKDDLWQYFTWPDKNPELLRTPPTVGQTLYAEMASCDWPDAAVWAQRASGIAPTLVGGSKKHGGPDLGPTRARLAWAKLGVNGNRIGDTPPGPNHEGLPYLTVKMAALIQGFPPDWEFAGRKTPAYRQVGNAFPPPVAEAVGRAIHRALVASEKPVLMEAD